MHGSSSVITLSDRIVVNPNSRPALRLFLFHHAGASAAAMLPLARQVPPAVEAVAFELAGRGVRSAEPAAQSFTQARDDLLGRVGDMLDVPVVLFGHSLGGLLADSLARALALTGAAVARRVIVSACPCPSAGQHSPDSSRRPVQQLKAQLRTHGGTPQAVFDCPELLEYVLRVLGDDMVLADTVTEPLRTAPASLRHEFWFGDSDQSTAPSTAEAWRMTLASEPEVRFFAGGHFYLFERLSDVGQALRALLSDEITAIAAPEGHV